MKTRNMERILVIDDDVELCTLVGEYLQAEGFVVEAAHDGESGLQRATGGGYLLVILDVMLPGINGFEVLRRIRATSRLPVLLLTARGEDVDRIVGLEIGTDDYLPKPFNPRELVARIRAVLRRTRSDKSSPAPPEMVRVGEIELDPATRSVRRDGQPVELTSSQRSAQEFFNTAAFAPPPAGQFGDAGRNTIPGPGMVNFNFSLDRHMIFSKERGLRGDFRIETTNLFNTPNFSGLATVVNGQGFGRVTSVRGMRGIAFSLRFRF